MWLTAGNWSGGNVFAGATDLASPLPAQGMPDDIMASAAGNLAHPAAAGDTGLAEMPPPAAVAALTRQTGRPPLLVAHSMGGLSARAWWRSVGHAGDPRAAPSRPQDHHAGFLRAAGAGACGEAGLFAERTLHRSSVVGLTQRNPHTQSVGPSVAAFEAQGSAKHIAKVACKGSRLKHGALNVV